MKFLSYNFTFFFFFFFLFNHAASESFASISSNYFSNLIVKIAFDEETKKKGLMGVKKLEGYNGMLFIYQKPKKVNIWMYNTEIPLDIIFINEKKKIVSIKNGIPNNLELISSEINIIAVLEIPLGCSRKINLNVGDILDWKLYYQYEIEKIQYFHCLQDKEKIK